MSVSEGTRVRTSLDNALREAAGLGLAVEPDGYHLDLRGLDTTAIVGRRQFALQTSASLLFQVDQSVDIVATLPESPKGRRVLAATGLMFALVQRHARFEIDTAVTANPPEEDDESLFTVERYRRLTLNESWRDTFTPFNAELRDLRLGAKRVEGELRSGLVASTREIGVYDKDLSAFVNPHLLPQGSAVSDIAEVANPWLKKLLLGESDSGVPVIQASLELLGHALDNVREHAFQGAGARRSLATMGKVDLGERQMFRVQILDNGIGIPASLAAQLSEPSNDQARARELLGLAIHGNRDGFDPLLSWGRGQGLPRMRELAGQVGGRLTISTRGPSGSQVRIDCDGSKPSDPWSDLIPVAGTIITLQVPIGTSREVVHAAEQEALDL